MNTRCSREPTVRKLKADLAHATDRINALDAFARRAGGILEDMFVSYSLTPEKDELARLVEEYHRIFPSDQSLEF